MAASRRAHALDESENVFNTPNGRFRTKFDRRRESAVANALPPRGFADGNGSAGRDDRGNADKTGFGKMRIRRYQFELQRKIFYGAIITQLTGLKAEFSLAKTEFVYRLSVSRPSGGNPMSLNASSSFLRTVSTLTPMPRISRSLAISCGVPERPFVGL